MAERPEDFIPGGGQPTPEEQLLRLIEAPDEEKPPAAEETQIEPKIERKAGVSLKGLGRYFSAVRFSLKGINRLLLGLAIILSIYLFLVISPIPGFGLTGLTHEQRYEEVVGKMKPLISDSKPIPEWTRDSNDVMKPWRERNVFIPIPKDPPPKDITSSDIIKVENKTGSEPITVTTKEFQELVNKSLKLLATYSDPEKPSVKKAVFEDNQDIFCRGPDDPNDTIVIADHKLRVKEVRDSAVTLIEVGKEKPLEATLELTKD